MSRTAILLFGALALVFGVAALYSAMTGVAPTGEGAPLLGVQPSQVQALRVVRPGETPIIVERAGDGSWSLRREGDDAGEAWPINPSNARGAVRVLCEMRPLSTADPETPINEVLRVELILDDGEKRSIQVDAESLGGRRLVRTGDGRAASVESAVVDAFTSPGPLAWRRRVALPGVGPEVSRITLVGRDATLRLVRAGSSWRIDEPVRMRAGDGAVRSLIGALAGAAVQRFIDDPEAAAEAPVGDDDTRLTILCETDERIFDEGGELRTVTRTASLAVGAPAGVDQASFFARTGAGQTMVIDGAVGQLSLDPAAYAAATAAATRPADVGAVIIRPATGEQRGYRRGIDGWSRMAPDGSLQPTDGEPIESLLSFFGERVAPRVAFEPPADLERIAIVTLLDFESGPLETIGVFRTPEALVCELRPIGATEPAYLVYPGAEAPALLPATD